GGEDRDPAVGHRHRVDQRLRLAGVPRRADVLRRHRRPAPGGRQAGGVRAAARQGLWDLAAAPAAPGPRAAGSGAGETPGRGRPGGGAPAPPRRILRWLAALSLALNAAFAVLWGARHLRGPRPAPAPRERARADLFHALAAGQSVQRDAVVVGDSLTERGEWW